METCEKRQETEDQEMQQQQQQQGYDERERSSASPFVKESGFEKGSIRLKIVLTKEELEWFMLQLTDKEGKMSTSIAAFLLHLLLLLLLLLLLPSICRLLMKF